MNFIYENDYSISPILCKEIIEMYENEEVKHKGRTLEGVNINVKDTFDFNIPHSHDTNSKWSKIEIFLYKELKNNLSKYIDQINCSNYKPEKNNNIDSTIFKNNTLEAYIFMIQKYNKGIGKYVYHDDFQIEKHSDKYKYRVITFLWYLNTIEEGGETEFWDSYKIKPLSGKLLLFPANWCFQHRGIMPISDNKYIITGWLYLSH
jgi:hypothetical protein